MKFWLSVFGGALLLTSCYRNQDKSGKTASRKYIHKYGVELSEKEWKEYGMHGEVVATREDGIIVTENYDHNVLHGNKTWSFPGTAEVQKTALYNKGACEKEIIHHTSGLPLSEVEFVSNSRKMKRTFSRESFPYSIETYDNDKLFDGQYFDTEGKLYAAVIDSQGERVMRDFEGVITRKEVIREGLPQQITEYFPNGRPKSITPCINGISHGIRRTFFESSEPASIEPWCEGKLDGTVLLFAAGVRVSEVPYINGQKHGLEYRYAGRRLTKEITWKKGRKHGLSIDHINTEMPKEWYWEGDAVSEFTYEQRASAR